MEQPVGVEQFADSVPGPLLLFEQRSKLPPRQSSSLAFHLDRELLDASYAQAPLTGRPDSRKAGFLTERVLEFLDLLLAEDCDLAV